MSRYDAVVVGAGINGLVAAAELAGAGWSVCVFEASPDIGGFIASEQLGEPGYTHDVYSSWHPLFVTGEAYAALGDDLARHGLSYRNTEGAVTASVAHDGGAAIAYRDPAETAARFASAEDGNRYLAALAELDKDSPAIGALMGTELRGPGSLRPLANIARAGGVSGAERWARQVATSGRAWCRREFTGSEVDQLWVPWLLHAGLAPDNASGGFMLPLLAATMHGAGLPVVEGGAGRFVAAFRGLLRERGVDIRAGAPVDRIVVSAGRAIGVESGDERIVANRAVLASVTPQALYRRLLPSHSVPDPVRAEAGRYRAGRAAMQVHVSLRAPLRWRDDALAGIPLVHLSDGSASTGVACAEAEAGLLPRRPTVVVGQQYLIDPTRVPDGAGSLWLQLQEVPYQPTADSAGQLDVSRGWSTELVDGYVDRVLDLIERHAPGTRADVLETRALSPVDLEARNRNAERGDPYGGSAELDQNLLWRPGPRTGRHRTAVAGLWHIGASTHPGPGLGGGSGHLVAGELTTERAGQRVRTFLTGKGGRR